MLHLVCFDNQLRTVAGGEPLIGTNEELIRHFRAAVWRIELAKERIKVRAAFSF